MKVLCPHCKKVLTVPDDYKGRKIRCAGCENSLTAEPLKKVKTLTNPTTPPAGTSGSSKKSFSIRRVVLGVILFFVVAGWISNRLVDNFESQIEQIESQIKQIKIPQTKTENEQVVSKPIFGIYLGKSVQSQKVKLSFLTSYDEVKAYRVNCNNPAVKNIYVVAYNKKVFAIYITFEDTSESNLDAIKSQLKKTYPINFKKTTFLSPSYEGVTHIASRTTSITLELKTYPEEVLNLMYFDMNIFSAWQQNLENKKAKKVRNDL